MYRDIIYSGSGGALHPVDVGAHRSDARFVCVCVCSHKWLRSRFRIRNDRIVHYDGFKYTYIRIHLSLPIVALVQIYGMWETHKVHLPFGKRVHCPSPIPTLQHTGDVVVFDVITDDDVQMAYLI